MNDNLQECYKVGGSCGYYYCGLVAMVTPCLVFLVMRVVLKCRGRDDVLWGGVVYDNVTWWQVLIFSITYPVWYPIENLINACQALRGNILGNVQVLYKYVFSHSVLPGNFFEYMLYIVFNSSFLKTKFGALL